MALGRAIKTWLAAFALSVAVTPAMAAFPVYPTSGTQNPFVYSFTAQGDGDLVAHFTGLSASFTNILGVRINGGPSILSTINSSTSAAGDSFNFGAVNAGDVFTFFIDVNDGEYSWFSDPALNADGANHIFSAAYLGGDFGIPAGTFVAFEDLSALEGSDFNYADIGFVFSNLDVATTAVPEPATWAMMILGFGLVGGAMRIRRRTVTFA